MEQKTRQEATGLLSGAYRGPGDDEKQHQAANHTSSSSSSSRSSSDNSSHADDDAWRSRPDDFDSDSPSSSAYPSFRSNHTLNRLFYSVGGAARRRALLGLASLILVSLMFWGFGVHTILLKEKEKFLHNSQPGSGVIPPPPPAVTPTSLPFLNGGSHANPVHDDLANPVPPAKVTPPTHAAPKPDPVKVEDKPETAPPPPPPPAHAVDVPAGTLDEHGHNRKPSNESDFCTTWPVDEMGGYKPKAIHGDQRHKLSSHAPAGGWKKPTGFKIIAMVFYGRKRNVDILDCYLRQNLASNGGYLDEIRFMVKTTNEDDIEWLRAFVKTVEGYKYQDLDLCTTQQGYGCIWEYADEDDTLYIKIDDDILYIHPDAIPQMVHTRLAVPEPFAVSAQLVNSPISGLQQYHYGAIHPFIPDPYSHPTRRPGEEWRPSKWGVLAKGMKAFIDGANMEVQASYDGHPWVLMTDSLADMTPLLKTPMGDWQGHLADDPAFGPGWKSWAIAAQQEYSLLYNIELDEMDRYHFGRRIRYDKTAPSHMATAAEPPAAAATPKQQQQSPRSASIVNPHPSTGGENLFDVQFMRYNLNFVAVWGRDVKLGLPVGDDEADFTQWIPRRLGRPFVIDTRAIVAHNSFFTQHGGIRQTDLLDRWRAVANELACKPDNLKVPWDLRCKGF
ncbi:uncharacterized protein B0I36DRAFT_359824 [Microdochium trichocladiopsis]|uniref:Uncharacterized protein n=1 Tax=Microdochium trichocladiopsis TaxID=1682393 RepID=A0A9P8YCI4_9PEZI|nr:uncharacterized protein B0I36DRAFT_359824 [Microdochium trichocladiopsis]KAH7038236.1 hypothetical protein B0I36DRAFT_359824 [Microdochium trichocladiopsis]